MPRLRSRSPKHIKAWFRQAPRNRILKCAVTAVRAGNSHSLRQDSRITVLISATGVRREKRSPLTCDQRHGPVSARKLAAIGCVLLAIGCVRLTVRWRLHSLRLCLLNLTATSREPIIGTLVDCRGFRDVCDDVGTSQLLLDGGVRALA